MCPPHALPTQSTGSVRPRPSSASAGAWAQSSKVKSQCIGSLLPCDGPSIAIRVRGARSSSASSSSIKGAQDPESMTKLCHRIVPGPVPRRSTCRRPRWVGTNSSVEQAITASTITSVTETSVSVVSSTLMAASRDLPADRQAVGQLLVRLTRQFRRDLAAPQVERGYGDIRDPHLQIFGNIRTGSIRLTTLAARAQLSLAATSELVNDLAALGYLSRRPDPQDGRAKLIELTHRGR